MARCNSPYSVVYSDGQSSQNADKSHNVEIYIHTHTRDMYSQILNSYSKCFHDINLNTVRSSSTSYTPAWRYNDSNFSISTTSAGGVAAMNSEKRESLKVLSDIALLRDNWNENGAKAFSNELIAACRELILQLRIQPDIYPTAEESIQFEWENSSGDYLEIELFENLECKRYLEKQDGSNETDFIKFSMVGDLVDKFFAT